MKSPLTWNDAQNPDVHCYNIQTLERSFQQPTRSRHTWKAQLNHLWQSAIARLALSDEPRAWHFQTEEGEIRWNAYDPRTGRSVRNISANELRIWLEQRYY